MQVGHHWQFMAQAFRRFAFLPPFSMYAQLFFEPAGGAIGLLIHCSAFSFSLSSCPSGDYRLFKRSKEHSLQWWVQF